MRSLSLLAAAALLCSGDSARDADAAAATVTVSLVSPLLLVSVSVGAAGTCLSSLQFNLSLAGDAAAGFSPNLLSAGAACGNRSSASALELASRPRHLLTPSGGVVVASNASYALIANISLGGAAQETWELSLLDGSGGGAAGDAQGAAAAALQQLRWRVRRTYLVADSALTDLFPALWMQSTTGGYDGEDVGVRAKGARGKRRARSRGRAPPRDTPATRWQLRVQMPSFFSLDASLVNMSSAAGWSAASGALASVWGDETVGATRDVLLSPAGVWMRVALESGRFSFSRFTNSWFEPQLGLGAECAAGPASTGYAFEAGDVRSNDLTLSFFPASNGFGFFDLAVPEGSPAAGAAASAKTFAKIYAMLLGWLNGNSPQSTTCIHEASLFSQLQGIFRITPPPPDAPLALGAGCGAFSNPFCGTATHQDNITLQLECSGGLITSIDAAYGTPSLGAACALERDASCDFAGMQAIAEAACLNRSSCVLSRRTGDPDPCPMVVKRIAATAACSPGGGGGRVPLVPGSCRVIQNASAAQLRFVLDASVRDDGFVAARWDVVGGNTWMQIVDQLPNVILFAFYHAVNTNDSAIIAELMPRLDLVAGFMRGSFLVDATAVFTNTEPQCDGRANVSCADNWLDDVRFGFKDAIVGAYAVEAFRALGDLKALVNDSAGAAENYALHARMVAAYNEAFWVANDTLCGGCGYFADWEDASGARRTYVYAWQQFAAIEFGIANASQAAAILASVDALYAEVRGAYNKTAAELWCTPTNFRGLAPDDLTIDFDGEYAFGNYENGACFHWHGGLEMLARGRAQGADAAFARFSALLAEFDNSRLWAQRYSWLDGSIEGDDVITDSMFALYGGLLASLNVRVSLFGGVEVLGPAAAALDGASLTIGVGGRDVAIVVRNGTAVVEG